MNNYVNLYEHNADAYSAVMNEFAVGRKAAVVQATGLGKAVMGGAVCRHFKKIILLAPSDAIIEQDKRYANNIEAHTYAWAMNQDAFRDDYDLIWLDEYHRAGGERWGGGVNLLLDTNPSAKVLGTTATDVRYLDNERNMSEELFDGNVVHRLDISEALARGIFSIGTYVKGLYTFDREYDDLKERIGRSRLSEENKAVSLDKLTSARVNWLTTGGVEKILGTYITNSMKGIIVFCDNIDSMNDMIPMVCEWFRNVGLKVGKVYSVSSDDRRSYEQIREFGDDKVDGIKIMFSVNMLNEGVHIDDVDAVVFLRSTKSKIIYLQQLGRCLTAYSGKSPVVLDLVDNMSSSDSIAPLKREYDNAVARLIERGETAYENNLNIIDTVVEYSDVVSALRDSLSLHMWTYEECLEEAKKCTYYKEFRENYPKAFGSAEHNGWLVSIVEEAGLVRSKNYWTFEQVAERAKDYDTFAEFEKENNGMAQCARKNGWIPKLNLYVKRHKWTDEELIEESMKYHTHKEFREANSSAYQAVTRMHLEDKCFAHLEKERRVLTDDMIREIAKSYPTRKAFSNGDTYAYKAACDRGIIDELIPLKNTTKTFEEIHELALGFKYKIEFRMAYPTEFDYATKKGWIKDICSHMPKRTPQEIVDKYKK